MRKDFKKRFFKALKKHTESLVLLSLALAILSLMMPFMVGDKYIFYQRIHVVNLNDKTEAYGSFGASLRFSASASVTITRNNSTAQNSAAQNNMTPLGGGQTVTSNAIPAS